MQALKPFAGLGAAAGPWGLIVGALMLGLTLVAPPPEGLAPAGWRTLGLAALMTIWWTTQALPIGVTALAPLILLPFLGAADIAAAAAPYANPIVFLFLGGFLMAAAVQRWGLHRRLALQAIRLFGMQPRRLVLGFMVTTAFLSMWISNTAAALLMLPVAAAVISDHEAAGEGPVATRRFSSALLLGLAYAASIGGVGTLIGTPANALLAGYLLDQQGLDLSFAAWSALAMPLVAVFLPLAWLLLTWLVFPLGPASGRRTTPASFAVSVARAPGLTAPEVRIGLVLLAAAALWLARPLLNRAPGLDALSDAGVALICASATFVIPSGAVDRGPLMTWRETRDIPWEVLLLFGGGLSLAAAMQDSGLAEWIGRQLQGAGALPRPVFILILVSTVVLLTEVVSNTAAVAALLPVVATVAVGLGLDPLSLAAATALAASCAFMLPVATPPNAVVFASGRVTMASMVRAGVLMNLLSILLVSIAAHVAAPLLRLFQ